MPSLLICRPGFLSESQFTMSLVGIEHFFTSAQLVEFAPDLMLKVISPTALMLLILNVSRWPPFCDHTVISTNVRLSVGPNLSGLGSIPRSRQSQMVASYVSRPCLQGRSRSSSQPGTVLLSTSKRVAMAKVSPMSLLSMKATQHRTLEHGPPDCFYIGIV
jgi:hypothetical protein